MNRMMFPNAFYPCYGPHNDVLIITVATHDDGYLDALDCSLRTSRGGPHQFRVLTGEWENYCSKTRMLYEHLVNVPESTIVIFCDAFDVLYDRQRDLKALAQLFRLANVDLLFSTMDVSKQPIYVRRFARKVLKCLDATGNNITCNGGLYMGYAGALKKLLGKIYVLKGETDDERCINQTLNAHTVSRVYLEEGAPFAKFHICIDGAPMAVGLDLNSRVFFNIPPPSSPLELLSKCEVDEKTFEKHDAFFYHFIGNQNLEKLCAHEGLCHAPKPCKYGKMNKLKHYSHFFDNELTFIVAGALIATVFLTVNINNSK